MRIGINLLYLIPGNVGGTETYAAGLLDGLAHVDQEDEFIIFLNREAADWPLPIKPNIERFLCPIRGSSRAHRYYYEQFRLPFLLRKLKIDLVHSLGYVGPVLAPCPAVVTIPDINYIDLAKTMPISRRLSLNYVSTRAARTAKQIITISMFSKERLCRTLKLPAEKITITHLAPFPEMTVSTIESWTELRKRYGIREPYIVAFGGGPIHKNITTLIQAFEKISDQLTHNLVLIGHLPPNVDMPMLTRRQKLRTRISAIGYVPISHIFSLLSHANLFVLPSLYEGFGLPVLEAQQAGVAVACSIAGSLPEVAGQGAIYFDPTSVDDLALTIQTILLDTETRQSLILRGKENLKRFSWEKTAQETLSVYRKSVSEIEGRRSNDSSELI